MGIELGPTPFPLMEMPCSIKSRFISQATYQPLPLIPVAVLPNHSEQGQLRSRYFGEGVQEHEDGTTDNKCVAQIYWS